MDPSDYDLDELRKLARKHGAGGEANGSDGTVDLSSVSGAGEGAVAGNSFRAGLYRELLPLEASADGLEKPYLASLPEHYAGEHLVFEWLEFLLLHAGYKGATEALDYYESVGWLTEDVESALGEYLLGIDDAGSADEPDLDIDDHLLSLVYVAKLANMT